MVKSLFSISVWALVVGAAWADEPLPRTVLEAGMYIQSAEQGDAEAQYCLGLLYEYGMGVEQSSA